MTTRIGTFGQEQFLISELMRHQSRMVETQLQVTSGRKADDLRGYAREAPALLSSQTLQARLEQYQRDNRELALKLQTYDTALRSIEDTAQTLREDVIQAINLNSGAVLIDKIENLLNHAIGVLNQQVDGRFIFGGSRTDSAPVTIATPAELAALVEPPAAAFANSQLKQSAKVDDQVAMSFGMLADEVGLPLLQSLQRILQYNGGTLAGGPPGPGTAFTDPLTNEQRDFLVGEVEQVTVVARQITKLASENGLRMSELEKIQERQRTEVNFLKTFIADLSEVDIAEAISRLNQDQLALEASYSVLGQLGRLSLIDFI